MNMRLMAAVALFAGLAGTTKPAPAIRPEIATIRAEATTANTLACSARTGHKLRWYGGAVGDPGTIVIVYWGSWWRSHGKPVEKELNNLYNGLGTSSWAATLKQYCDRHGPPVWSNRVFLAFPDFRNPRNKAPSEDQLSQESNWVWSHFKCSGGCHGLTVIVTPPGITPAYDTKHGACGHHNWSKAPGNPPVPWIDIPYGILLRTHGCDWNLKQGVPGAVSIVAGHEWAEAITDPYPTTRSATGWATSATRTKREQEVGDVCQPVPDHSFQPNVIVLKLKTGSFVMQKLWSNAAAKCVAHTG